MVRITSTRDLVNQAIDTTNIVHCVRLLKGPSAYECTSCILECQALLGGFQAEDTSWNDLVGPG